MSVIRTLTGTPEDILSAVEQVEPGTLAALQAARAVVLPSSRAIAEYQAATLYALAKPYDRAGARVLEIGTAQGYSAAVLALAMPHAHITTLNPHPGEVRDARESLRTFGVFVEVVQALSWDYLASYEGEPFDFIFVDGDHKNIRLDLPWWDHLREGGMMLFHDYSPNGTPRPCPPVYRALNEFRDRMTHDFDVRVIDDTGVGMVGFVRRAGEVYDPDERDLLATAYAYSSASYSYLSGLYRLAQSARHLDGALVECGCGSGGSAAALAAAVGSERRMVLFDTFTGVPKPAPEDGEKAMLRWELNQSENGGKGWAVGSMKSVHEVMERLGVPGIEVWAGLFETAFAALDFAEPVALLHIDATLYRSTRQALERFYPLVVPGGLVIVSAYAHWQGIASAVSDYFEGSLSPTFTTLEKGIWWRK